jgi:hypothetical protein
MLRKYLGERRYARRNNATRAGAAAVEFAVVLPVLITLFLGGIDFGRSGAFYASMHNHTEYTRTFWEEQIRAAVIEEMQNLSGFKSDDLGVEISSTVDSQGLFRVGVEVSYPFTTATDWPMLPRNVMLRNRVVMRQIR